MPNRIKVSRDTGTPEHITIYWDVYAEGSYIARRTMPGVNKTARLPELDCGELLEVMKHLRDFLNDSMPLEYLEPPEIV
jgi:hypothetical protein